MRNGRTSERGGLLAGEFALFALGVVTVFIAPVIAPGLFMLAWVVVIFRGLTSRRVMWAVMLTLVFVSSLLVVMGGKQIVTDALGSVG